MKSNYINIDQSTIISIYDTYIPEFSYNGKKQVICRCPFPLHVDKNPSFSVDTSNGLFHCFGCDAKGNAFTFVQDNFNLTFKNALLKIESDFNIKFDKAPNNTATPQPLTAPLHKEVKTLSIKNILTLHNQLLNNKEVLNAFQIKYGLDLNTVKAYLIGYQNEKYVIPINVGKNRFTIKEHKGKQTYNAKAQLWPKKMLDKLKEESVVIITEGEFKALLLIQQGYCAVSGTSGAQTWSSDWNYHFKDKSVFICFDDDKPGIKGGDSVAKQLNGICKEVKIVKWPLCMKGKELNDVTDYFTKLEKCKDDFESLLNKAEIFKEGMKRILGHRFRDPDYFEIEEDKVLFSKHLKDGCVKTTIFPCPVIISRRAIDLDTSSEELEIMFKRDGSVRTVWIPRRVAMDSKRIVDYCDVGLPVQSRNAGVFVDFLYSFECENIKLIPKSFITKECGWKDINDESVFVVGSHVVNKSKSVVDLHSTTDYGFERYVNALNKNGSYGDWKNSIEFILKYKYAMFAFYASFVPPLLKILKAPNFVIDFWGGSSLGKTTILEMAASVWGNPYKENRGLVFNWDSTRVFLERASNFFNDLPIFPDDSQTVDKKLLAKILYMVANGSGRGRGSIEGIKKVAAWRTVCFSTGEKPLTDCSENEGIRARVIGLYGSPLPNIGGSAIEDFKNCIRENYGHAGFKYINYLVSIINNKVELDKLKREYSRYKKELANDASNEVGDRISQYFACTKVASDLVCDVLGIGDKNRNEDKISKLFKSYINDLHHNYDIGSRAFATVLSWVQENYDFFTIMGKKKLKSQVKSIGVIKIGEYIGIYPHLLLDVMEKYNFSYKTICKIWSERGWIRRHGRNMTYTVWLNNKEQRQVIYIHWSAKTTFENT